MEKGLLSSNISLSKENLGCLGMPGREKECNLEAVVVRGLVWSCAVSERVVQVKRWSLYSV